MPSSLLPRSSGRGWLTLALGLGLSLALTAVGWRDYVLARGELGTLVRAQATSVRDAVAAAARSNLTAADEMQQAFADRLLDNARLLAAQDRRAPLTDEDLSAVVGQNRLFRVVVVRADRSRAASAGGGGALGHGPGRGSGAGLGMGPGGAGLGMGPGGAGLVERLLQTGDQEAVTGVHTGRRDGAARLAAGVRLASGGVIVVSVDASDVMQLQRQSGLGHLLDDIVRHTSDVAYLVFEQRDVRLARGDVPSTEMTAPGRASIEQGMPAERELLVSGRPVLELTSPIDLGGGRRGSIVLGMRLDALRQAERRTLTRLATSLSAAAALGVLAIGLVWLRERYGALSVEHARAQEALRRKDRLTAMGELASTVAHEIRNPLNAIVMSAQRLSREYFGTAAATPADQDDARALVGVVASEAARIDDKVTAVPRVREAEGPSAPHDAASSLDPARRRQPGGARGQSRGGDRSAERSRTAAWCSTRTSSGRCSTTS